MDMHRPIFTIFVKSIFLAAIWSKLLSVRRGVGDKHPANFGRTLPGEIIQSEVGSTCPMGFQSVFAFNLVSLAMGLKALLTVSRGFVSSSENFSSFTTRGVSGSSFVLEWLFVPKFSVRLLTVGVGPVLGLVLVFPLSW